MGTAIKDNTVWKDLSPEQKVSYRQLDLAKTAINNNLNKAFSVKEFTCTMITREEFENHYLETLKLWVF